MAHVGLLFRVTFYSCNNNNNSGPTLADLYSVLSLWSSSGDFALPVKSSDV